MCDEHGVCVRKETSVLDFHNFLKRMVGAPKSGPRIVKHPDNYWSLQEIADRLGKRWQWLAEILTLDILPEGALTHETTYLEAFTMAKAVRIERRETHRCQRMMRV